MRHLVFGRKLGRDVSQRNALLRNLASAVLLSGSVVTTEAKAKFAKNYIEKIITTSQKKGLHAKRSAASSLEKKAFKRLSEEVAPGLAGRKGGYTRLIKLESRRGDNASMVRIELVEFAKIAKKAEKKETVKETTKKEEVKK